MKNKYLIHTDISEYDLSVITKDLPKVLAKLFFRFPEIVKIKCPSGQWFNFDISKSDNKNIMFYEQLWLGFVSSILSEKERTIYKNYLRGEKKW